MENTRFAKRVSFKYPFKLTSFKFESKKKNGEQTS